MNIIEAQQTDFSPKRFWVYVKCTDPFFDGETRRIEVHRDVAKYIYDLKSYIKDLEEQIASASKQRRITK